MHDFNIIDVPALLATPVSSYDSAGRQVPDDGEWHRRAVETDYILAKFLVAKGLILGTTNVELTPMLTIKFSELTAEGKEFAREAVAKWQTSMDRPSAKLTDAGLERRWQKFKAKIA
ncbi:MULTISPECIES: hypothetical protein [unclassified Novosphingobium]|uniref:hypothetical protein n=1 Tax=unclassified Novosphingobium TaxID=2644732 RepID=UPI00146F5957|nr:MULTISPECIES: hypothetical protein [unclassified Novosphingobium]NMN02975.1 hypothetical protein [Novosphingobium sp. SG919]NMN87038.1 hypothetical protein [Novosphingobium sp. SG916]